MRFIRITHIYDLPVPEDDFETIDASATQGIALMNRFMHQRAANIVPGSMQANWQMLPKEYQPPSGGAVEVLPRVHDGRVFEATESEATKFAIEHDLDHGVSLLPNSGPLPPHPWEQGLWIFPDDHPLSKLERLAKEREDTEMLDVLYAEAPKLKQITEGSDG